MSLVGRWIDLIFRVATGNWKVKVVLAPVAGLLYLSLIGSFIFLSLIVDRWLGLPKVFHYPASLLLGYCIIAAGFVLMGLSIACFLRVRGTPVPFSPPPKLVASGPYRYSRNPMLTGLFMQLFGLGIVVGSVSLVAIFTPLFIALNVWELKKVEEPELEKRLGDEYAAYRKRVPMFFPFSDGGRNERNNLH